MFDSGPACLVFLLAYPTRQGPEMESLHGSGKLNVSRCTFEASDCNASAPDEKCHV